MDHKGEDNLNDSSKYDTSVRRRGSFDGAVLSVENRRRPNNSTTAEGISWNGRTINRENVEEDVEEEDVEERDIKENMFAHRKERPRNRSVEIVVAEIVQGDVPINSNRSNAERSNIERSGDYYHSIRLEGIEANQLRGVKQRRLRTAETTTDYSVNKTLEFHSIVDGNVMTPDQSKNISHQRFNPLPQWSSECSNDDQTSKRIDLATLALFTDALPMSDTSAICDSLPSRRGSKSVWSPENVSHYSPNSGFSSPSSPLRHCSTTTSSQFFNISKRPLRRSNSDVEQRTSRSYGASAGQSCGGDFKSEKFGGSENFRRPSYTRRNTADRIDTTSQFENGKSEHLSFQERGPNRPLHHPFQSSLTGRETNSNILQSELSTEERHSIKCTAAHSPDILLSSSSQPNVLPTRRMSSIGVQPIHKLYKTGSSRPFTRNSGEAFAFIIHFTFIDVWCNSSKCVFSDFVQSKSFPESEKTMAQRDRTSIMLDRGTVNKGTPDVKMGHSIKKKHSPIKTRFSLPLDCNRIPSSSLSSSLSSSEFPNHSRAEKNPLRVPHQSTGQNSPNGSEDCPVGPSRRRSRRYQECVKKEHGRSQLEPPSCISKAELLLKRQLTSLERDVTSQQSISQHITADRQFLDSAGLPQNSTPSSIAVHRLDSSSSCEKNPTAFSASRDWEKCKMFKPLFGERSIILGPTPFIYPQHQENELPSDVESSDVNGAAVPHSALGMMEFCKDEAPSHHQFNIYSESATLSSVPHMIELPPDTDQQREQQARCSFDIISQPSYYLDASSYVTPTNLVLANRHASNAAEELKRCKQLRQVEDQPTPHASTLLSSLVSALTHKKREKKYDGNEKNDVAGAQDKSSKQMLGFSDSSAHNFSPVKIVKLSGCLIDETQMGETSAHFRGNRHLSSSCGSDLPSNPPSDSLTPPPSVEKICESLQQRSLSSGSIMSKKDEKLEPWSRQCRRHSSGPARTAGEHLQQQNIMNKFMQCTTSKRSSVVTEKDTWLIQRSRSSILPDTDSNAFREESGKDDSQLMVNHSTRKYSISAQSTSGRKQSFLAETLSRFGSWFGAPSRTSASNLSDRRRDAEQSPNKNKNCGNRNRFTPGTLRNRHRHATTGYCHMGLLPYKPSPTMSHQKNWNSSDGSDTDDNFDSAGRNHPCQAPIQSLVVYDTGGVDVEVQSELDPYALVGTSSGKIRRYAPSSYPRKRKQKEYSPKTMKVPHRQHMTSTRNDKPLESYERLLTGVDSSSYNNSAENMKCDDNAEQPRDSDTQFVNSSNSKTFSEPSRSPHSEKISLSKFADQNSMRQSAKVIQRMSSIFQKASGKSPTTTACSPKTPGQLSSRSVKLAKAKSVLSYKSSSYSGMHSTKPLSIHSSGTDRRPNENQKYYYFGETHRNRRHGWGTLVNDKRVLFEGQWRFGTCIGWYLIHHEFSCEIGKSSLAGDHGVMIMGDKNMYVIPYTHQYPRYASLSNTSKTDDEFIQGRSANDTFPVSSSLSDFSKDPTRSGRERETRLSLSPYLDGTAERLARPYMKRIKAHRLAELSRRAKARRSQRCRSSTDFRDFQTIQRRASTSSTDHPPSLSPWPSSDKSPCSHTPLSNTEECSPISWASQSVGDLNCGLLPPTDRCKEFFHSQSASLERGKQTRPRARRHSSALTSDSTKLKSQFGNHLQADFNIPKYRMDCLQSTYARAVRDDLFESPTHSLRAYTNRNDEPSNLEYNPEFSAYSSSVAQPRHERMIPAIHSTFIGPRQLRRACREDTRKPSSAQRKSSNEVQFDLRSSDIKETYMTSSSSDDDDENGSLHLSDETTPKVLRRGATYPETFSTEISMSDIMLRRFAVVLKTGNHRTRTDRTGEANESNYSSFGSFELDQRISSQEAPAALDRPHNDDEDVVQTSPISRSSPGFFKLASETPGWLRASDCLHWTTNQLCLFLQMIGSSDEAVIARRNKLAGADISRMTERRLITKLGLRGWSAARRHHRKFLLSVFRYLSSTIDKGDILLPPTSRQYVQPSIGSICEISRSDIDIGKRLGSGGYADVHSATYNGQKVACKVFSYSVSSVQRSRVASQFRGAETKRKGLSPLRSVSSTNDSPTHSVVSQQTTAGGFGSGTSHPDQFTGRKGSSSDRFIGLSGIGQQRSNETSHDSSTRQCRSFFSRNRDPPNDDLSIAVDDGGGENNNDGAERGSVGTDHLFSHASTFVRRDPLIDSNLQGLFY